MTLSTSTLKSIIITVTICAVIAMALVSPIPQDTLFHQFADHRICFNIPNFWNVASNIGFVLVGVIGLYRLTATQSLNIIPEIKIGYLIFFMGITLVAFGSGFYHLMPNNQTLVWDRLPMTIAFMALLAIALSEYLSTTLGRLCLWPLLFIGVISVFYWYWGELHGNGDLRLYALVQFLPIIILPILLLFGKSKFQNSLGYWLLFCAYAIAKVVEYYDVFIFKLTSNMVSGHTIKHFVTAIGLFALLTFYGKRRLCK